MAVTEEVVLVNEHDEPTGVMEKMAAHQKPVLHRAFSVFLFNDEGKMLLQQRALSKYHSAGLWTNACCSHPRPAESVKDAARRRVREELGIDAPVDFAFHFIYQASFENGLHEYEYDHVFTGRYNGAIQPDFDEVHAYDYKSLDDIKEDLVARPAMYTEWFKIALPKLEIYLQGRSLQ